MGAERRPEPREDLGLLDGHVGLAYETAFRYDPLKDKFIPWLATSGKWRTKTST